MIGRFVCLLLISWAIALGFLLVTLLWPHGANARRSAIFRAFVGCGVGMGTVSAATFIVLAVSPWRRAGLLATMLVTTAVLGALLWRRRVRSHSNASEPGPAGTRVASWLGLASVVIFGLAIVTCVSHFMSEPSGGWDAWAIWNLRARFLVRASNLARVFDPHMFWSRLDYPLLVPGAVACGWLLSGSETTLAPMLVAAVFMAATVGLVAASLELLRDRTQGILAAAILAGTPQFLSMGSWQMADVPLSFFVLASLALVALVEDGRFSEREHARRRLSGLLGFVLGCALWTKNEGWVLLIAVLIVWGGVWLRRRRQVLLGMACGLLPWVLLVAFFRIRFGLRTPYVDAQVSSEGHARLFDGWRYRTIGKWFALEAWQFGGWRIVVPALLLAYALWVGRTRNGGARRSSARIGLCLLVTLAGYFFVYLTGPSELVWWLGTSLDRLFMQLWPSALFSLFLGLRSVAADSENLLECDQAARSARQL